MTRHLRQRSHPRGTPSAWLAQEQLRAERLASVRARIAEADADPCPSLSEDDVTRHLEARRPAPRPTPTT